MYILCENLTLYKHLSKARMVQNINYTYTVPMTVEMIAILTSLIHFVVKVTSHAYM